MLAIAPINTTPIQPLAGGYSPGGGSQVELVLSNVIGILTLVAGLAFLFYFFLGTLNLLTSSGDPQRVQKARQFILNSITGLAITVTAYAVAWVITHLVGIDITRPSTVLNNLVFR